MYALLPHPTEPLVLAYDGPAGIELPNSVEDEPVSPWDTNRLRSMLEAEIGAPINILRYVARHTDREASRIYSIQLLEPRSDTLLPAAFWQPLKAILDNMVLPPALGEGLKRWQTEENSGIIPERRALWALPGWYAQAEHWILDQVSRLGRGTVQEIQPVKSWSISCVLKVITEKGLLYFKAARDLPLFVNEGLVLRYLAKAYPGRVPRPLAVHAEQGWILLDDFGAVPESGVSLTEQARLMQDFAQLQIDSSEKIEFLLTAGCADVGRMFCCHKSSPCSTTKSRSLR